VKRTLLLIGLSVVIFTASAEADSLYTRNLACDKRFAARELAICKALERELEWVWTGHASISPGYRSTFESARRIFCSLPITAGDTRALVMIAVAAERSSTTTFADAQLANGSRFLLNLLGRRALEEYPAHAKEWDERSWQIAKNLREEISSNINDPGMIWHPQNPQYLLRGGCK
jgi:hypothetical protein